MTTAVAERPDSACTSCGADEGGCGVKRWLSGRACCNACEHPEAPT